MDFILQLMFIALVLGGICLAMAAWWSLLPLVHFILTLPMRRAERARLFLNLVETALKDGRPVEETILSAAASRDPMLGVHFYLVAAWLEQNARLEEALTRAPRLLPAQVNAMLRAGKKIGDLGKVLPACRQLLKDGVSQTRAAINYLVVLTFILTPFAMILAGFIKVKVLPKFLEIGRGTLGAGPIPSATLFVNDHLWLMIGVQAVLLALLWLAVAVYIGGPVLVDWFPVLERVHFRMPWRRKRLQRDFSTMLAVLLDSGVPESEAITLAADCTANRTFRVRAARAVERLKQGMTLTEAIRSMDDAGEFGWRMANAVHGSGGFFRALAGWHESLDAKAFQEEQAAAHGITSAILLWSGLLVGAVVVSIFGFLTSIINTGILW